MTDAGRQVQAPGNGDPDSIGIGPEGAAHKRLLSPFSGPPGAAADRRELRRRRITRFLRQGVLYAVLAAIGLTMVLPFMWMLSTSLKTARAAVEVPPTWIPRETATSATYRDKPVAAHILAKTAVVRRLDTGETFTVYDQTLRTGHPWYAPWASPVATASLPAAPGQPGVRVPVQVISSVARIRVLEPGGDNLKVVDVPGSAAATRSWVSLKWANYPDTWNKLPFGRSYINTTVMAVTVTIGQVLTSSLAAFAFARLRFPGRDKLFLGYLATMMIPEAVTLIPVYVLFVKMPELLNYVFHTVWFTRDFYFLGKYYVGRIVGGNSYFALIAPGLFSAYGTFMLRQFFMNLPRELEDAARIDGCGNLRIYWHVTVPLSKVALATLATFVFMGSWKEFMWPLIINNNENLLPLQVLLQRFVGQHGSEYTLLMAGSVIVLAPVILVFIVGQRYFIKGIQLGGVKG
jgi:multiple sugar transport system permease protein